MKVSNLTNVNGKKVPNQFIVENENEKVFQSYETTIAKVDNYNNLLNVYSEFNYSCTTSRHFKNFITYETNYDYDTIIGILKYLDKIGYWSDNTVAIFNLDEKLMMTTFPDYYNLEELKSYVKSGGTF